RCASSTMARFSQTAQDRRVLATTVCEKAFGPDIGTIQVPPTDLYRSHPNPGLTRRHWPGAYPGAHCRARTRSQPSAPCAPQTQPLLGRVCKLELDRGSTGLSPVGHRTHLAEEPSNGLR